MSSSLPQGFDYVRLFAMSARAPTDVNHSLTLLKPRDGEIGPHSDGWGVAFYEGRAARIFKEPIPAAESRCLAFITEYDFKSETVIAHIRRASPENIGRASANMHPFEREWNGRSWVFAHNGKLPGLRRKFGHAVNRFQPLGDTDSEFAFCTLMEAIAGADASACDHLPAQVIVERIRPRVRQMARLGAFNFLLSDGKNLIAHAHTNLHALRRSCTGECGDCEVILLATSPLTDEPWTMLQPGSIHVYAGGREMIAPAIMPAPGGSGRQVTATNLAESSLPIGEMQ